MINQQNNFIIHQQVLLCFDENKQSEDIEFYKNLIDYFQSYLKQMKKLMMKWKWKKSLNILNLLHKVI